MIPVIGRVRQINRRRARTESVETAGQLVSAFNLKNRNEVVKNKELRSIAITTLFITAITLI